MHRHLHRPQDVPRVRGSLQPPAAIACASIASTLLLAHISYPPSPPPKANHAGARAETPAGAHPRRRTQGTWTGIILVRDCVLPTELQATQDTESIMAMHDAEEHRCRYRDRAPSLFPCPRPSRSRPRMQTTTDSGRWASPSFSFDGRAMLGDAFEKVASSRRLPSLVPTAAFTSLLPHFLCPLLPRGCSMSAVTLRGPHLGDVSSLSCP